MFSFGFLLIVLAKRLPEQTLRRVSFPRYLPNKENNRPPFVFADFENTTITFVKSNWLTLFFRLCMRLQFDFVKISNNAVHQATDNYELNDHVLCRLMFVLFSIICVLFLKYTFLQVF